LQDCVFTEILEQPFPELRVVNEHLVLRRLEWFYYFGEVLELQFLLVVELEDVRELSRSDVPILLGVNLTPRSKHLLHFVVIVHQFDELLVSENFDLFRL